MIIHSPIISGSLTFADGATFTLPDNGIYSGSFSGSIQVHQVKSDLIPDVSGAYDLGSEAFPFQDLWLVGNTLNIGGIGIGTTALSGGPGLDIKRKSDDTPADIGAKSISFGGIGGVGSKKFKLNDNNKVTIEDENGDPDTIEVKEIILKDTSGNGKNTKVRNDNGKFTTQEVNDSGSVTNTDAEGSLSGSFTGSVLDLVANGDATFNDAVTVSGLSSLDGGIDVDGAFTVADTSGNVSTSGTLSVTGVSSFGVISGSSLDLTGNVDIDGTATIGGTITVDGHIIPAIHNTYDLGSTTKYWRDLYLSSGSLYINGIQVLSTDGTDLTVQTDAGESLKLLETGNDTITLETANGDITLTSSGAGNIELDAPIQIAAGRNILSSDGNAITFANDVNLGSNDIFAANLVGVVSSSAISYDGNNVTVLGNFTVQGDTTTLNTSTLIVEDKVITLASGSTSAAEASNAGIEIAGTTAAGTTDRIKFSWIENQGWYSTDNLYVSGMNGEISAGNGNFNTLSSYGATPEVEVDSSNSFIVAKDKLKIDSTAVTTTAAELNLLDTAVAGTIVNEKAVIYGAAGEVNATTLQIGGTSITATATELNILDDATVTTTELNYVSGVTSAIQDQLDDKIALTAISATDAGGDGSFSYDNTTGVFTYTGPSATEVRAHFSGGTGVTITDGSIAIGQAVATNSSVTFASVSATGDIVAYASSDERLKDNIEVISNPIEKVQQLKGVTWDWNDNADELQKSLPNVGVIAQDVEKVLPQVVKDRENGFKGVDYDKIVGLLIEAIKDQQSQIDELKAQLK